MVLVWLVCPKLQHDLQLALDHTRSYSLHTPQRNQATAFFLQTLVKLQPALPRENQITTVYISLNQTHPCSLHVRNRSQVVALGLQADTYSYIIGTGYLNRNPATTCILTKLPKPTNSLYSPHAFFKLHLSFKGKLYSLHSPAGANLPPIRSPDMSHLEPAPPLSWIRNSRARKTRGSAQPFLQRGVS